MAEPKTTTTARDIMLKRHLRLGESHTLEEVIGFLLHPRFEVEGLPFLVVISSDGTLAGMVSPVSIFRALTGEGEADDETVLQQAHSRLSTPIREVMVRPSRTLGPEAPLHEVFTVFAEANASAVPVVEDDRVIGLITTRILFENASTLTVGALSGGGIILPGNE